VIINEHNATVQQLAIPETETAGLIETLEQVFLCWREL